MDLPDAVGHPVFPTTLEALVASSRGTVLDAARDALERDDAMEFAVRAPRLLVPLCSIGSLTCAVRGLMRTEVRAPVGRIHGKIDDRSPTA